MEGTKEKLLEVRVIQNADRESLRNFIKSHKNAAQESPETKLLSQKALDNNVIKEQMQKLQKKMAAEVTDLAQKSNQNITGLKNRFEKFDDLMGKIEEKVLLLERQQVEQRQDLESHKLLKRRQIDNLEEKAWEIRDFKEELQRQLDEVLEHTHNVTENCNE